MDDEIKDAAEKRRTRASERWYAVLGHDSKSASAWGAGTSPDGAMANAHLILSEVGETCDDLRTVEINEGRYRSITEEGRIDADDLWPMACVTLEQALEKAVYWATKAGTLALAEKRDAMAARMDAAAADARSALSRVRREKAKTT